MNIEKDFYKIKKNTILLENTINEWRKIINIDKNILKTFKFIGIDISIFLEIYHKLNNSYPQYYPSNSPSQFLASGISSRYLPDGFIEWEDAYLRLFKNINHYIKYDLNTKLKIKEEYFNILTNRKGILLENGVRVEDGQYYSEINEEYEQKIKDFIADEIKYILCPDMRKQLIRKKKLKKIL